MLTIAIDKALYNFDEKIHNFFDVFLQKIEAGLCFDFSVSDQILLEEKVKNLIIRDLKKASWSVEKSILDDKIILCPPIKYDRATIKSAMAVRRKEIIIDNTEWISKHLGLARKNLASGNDVLASKIDPIIEVCETQEQKNLFRMYRYYWSSPYSDYVGRRVKLLIRDQGLPNKPVIGIAALGSPIIHIPERDKWVGWDKDTRTKNLIYTMDAYVLGALPPYNLLLGGKLVSYLMASNEIREIVKNKYKMTITRQEKRIASDLLCIFTTSLYGRSIQYNQLKYDEELLFHPIGETKGFGTFHLSEETFQAMLSLLRAKNINLKYNFGDGPSWRMRVVRLVAGILGFDASVLLGHTFKRNIFAVPLAQNFRDVLGGKTNEIQYKDIPIKSLVHFWKNRWLNKRLQSSEIIEQVKNFTPQDFLITETY